MKHRAVLEKSVRPVEDTEGSAKRSGYKRRPGVSRWRLGRMGVLALMMSYCAQSHSDFPRRGVLDLGFMATPDGLVIETIYQPAIPPGPLEANRNRFQMGDLLQSINGVAVRVM